MGLGPGLGHQVSDHVAEPPLRSDDLFVSMQESCELGVPVPVGLVRDEGVGLEDGFKSLASATGLIPSFGQMLEVAVDLTLVPRVQHGP